MKTTPVSTGEVPEILQNLVFNVTSVVFTDGSYEGEPLPAAMFLAGKLGEKAQLRSFLERVRTNGPITSESDVEAAISAVNINSLAAELITKFPDLTATEKTQIPGVIDFGRSLGVKFFRTASADPKGSLVELVQARIDALP